jgi:uncharacterized membrane protein
MSPEGQTPVAKVAAANNIYTAILALVFCVVLVTAAFVAIKCISQYGTIFKIP